MGIKRPIKVKLGGEKYCPINSHPKSDGMCKKEKCAWWSESTEDCAILMIGNYIATGWALLYDFLGKDKKEVK